MSAQTADEPDPAKLFEQGQDAHARGDFAAALRLYDEALAAAPDTPEIIFQRGAALASLNRRDEAEKAYRRAIELRPDWAQAHRALGLLLLRHADPSGGVRPDQLQRREPEALRLLERALELDPKDSRSHAALEDLVERSSKDIQMLRRLTANPDANAQLWLMRARAEHEAKDIRAASESIERATKLDPRDIHVLLLRAQLRLEADDLPGTAAELRSLDEALTVAHKNSQNFSQASDVILSAASFYAQLGERTRRADPPASLGYYRRAIELAPASDKYATGYAAALVQARRFDDAVRILRQVIAAAPDNYAAHANLAAALDELKRYDEALAEYRWLRERQPEIVITDFFIARAHDLLGQYREALASYEAFLARASPTMQNLEIEKVKLRLPALRRQAAQAKRGK